MMGSRTPAERLQQIPPRTGRKIRGDGSVVNVADLAARQDSVDTRLRAAEGVVYQSVFVGTLPANGALHFRQLVPVGHRIQGVSVSAVVVGGPVVYDLRMGATPGPVAATLSAYNADRDRFYTDPQPGSVIQRLSSATGGELLDSDRAGASTGQLSRTAGTLTGGAGLGGIFSNGVEPYFSFFNLDNNAHEIRVRWVWADITGVLDV